MITLIAAIGKNNEIGLDGKMPWHIPEDLKHFKEYTIGKTIVMGRKTFQSIRKPLPNRTNIVISKSTQFPDVMNVTSLLDALNYTNDELVIIGGAQVYQLAMHVADKLVITHIDSEFQADTFFPSIDLNIWKNRSEITGKNETLSYKFVEYTR